MGLLDDDRIYDILESQRESSEPKKARARKEPAKKIAQKEEPEPVESPKAYSLLDDDKIYGILENQRAAYSPDRPKPIEINARSKSFQQKIAGQKDKAGFWRKVFEKVSRKVKEDEAGNATVKVNNPQSMRFSKTFGKNKFKDIMGKDLEEHGASPTGWGVKTKNIDSTCINSYSYNPDTQDLQIKFQKGKKIYSYPNVPKAVVDDLGGASSKGMYFHQNIKPYSVKSYRTPQDLLQADGWQK